MGVVYRSPCSSSDNDSRWLNLLAEIHKLGSSHLLVTGDFNLPLIDWRLWTAPDRDLIGHLFLDTVNDCLCFNLN